MVDFERDLASGKVKVQVLINQFWVWLDLQAIRKLDSADIPFQ
ncbi:hypothetical protein ACFSJQ_01970 [Vibrio olivae]